MNQLIRTDLISGNIMYIHRFKEEEHEIVEVFVLLPSSAITSKKQFDYEQANAIARQFTSALEDSTILGDLFKAENSDTGGIVIINNREHHVLAGEEKFKAQTLIDIARDTLDKERSNKKINYGIVPMK